MVEEKTIYVGLIRYMFFLKLTLNKKVEYIIVSKYRVQNV